MSSALLLMAGLLVAGPEAGGAEMQPTQAARELATAVKAEVKSFRLVLAYSGDQEKPFYVVTLQTAAPEETANSFYRRSRLEEAEAAALIEHLLASGFFDAARSPKELGEGPPLSAPGYSLRLTTETYALVQDWGWNSAMLRRMEALQKAAPERVRSDFEFLLGRLSGFRRQWEAE